MRYSNDEYQFLEKIICIEKPKVRRETTMLPLRIRINVISSAVR